MEIKAEETHKKALVSEMNSLRTAGTAPQVDGEAIARELKEAAADVRTLLAGATVQARQMLRKILDGKELRAEPIECDGRRGYGLSGQLCVGRLLPTEILRETEDEKTSKTVVAPTGFAPVFPRRRALLPAN